MAKAECQWGAECGGSAQWQVMIKLWALATPKGMRTAKNCLRMMTSVTVCDDCRKKVKAQDFLLPEGRERIATGLQRAGVAMADFANAELDFEPVIDKPIDIDAMLIGAKVNGHSVIES